MTEPSPVSSRARRALVATGIWAGITVVVTLLLLGRPVNTRDETWMLWVATRMARGEVLYRDVYNVTTPIAAWGAAAAVRVFGVQLAVVRALAAGTFAAEVVMALSVARRVGMRVAARVVLVLVLVGFASPLVAFVSLYSAVAILGALVTLRAVLWWQDRFAAVLPGAAWAVGAAVAVTFWAKPNVGMLAGVAVLAAMAATAARTGFRALLPEALRMAGGAVGISVGVVAVVAGTGGWSAFVDQVFLSKGAYVDVGFSYFTALSDRVSVLSWGTGEVELHRLLNFVIHVSLPVLVVALVVGVWCARRASREQVVALAAFTVAGLLAIFPRPGVNHITGVLPLAATGLAGVWTLALATRPAAAARAPRPVGPGVLVAGAVAVVAVAVVAVPLVTHRDRPRLEHDVAHFVGTPVSRSQARAAARLGTALRDRGVRTVFIVREDAGFLYLRTGAHNPLPYDIVERSDLGASGQHGVIDRIVAGEVPWVCLHPPRPHAKADDELVPRRLERWVRANLEPAGLLPRCELYRATAGRLTGPRA
ncbi:MAG: hypothetical protein WDA60_12185 [Acidimicrobiia bacterium]